MSTRQTILEYIQRTVEANRAGMIAAKISGDQPLQIACFLLAVTIRSFAGSTITELFDRNALSALDEPS